MPAKGDAVTIGRRKWEVASETTPEGHAERYGVRRFRVWNPDKKAEQKEAVYDTATGEWSWHDGSGSPGGQGGAKRGRVNWRA